MEIVHGSLKASTLVVSKLGTICHYGNDTQSDQQVFVVGGESLCRVAQRQHCPCQGEGLVGIAPCVLTKGEHPVKKEA